MAGLYVKNAGTWYLPKSIWVKYANTWRVCNNVYIKHGGVWREMIKSVTLSYSTTNFNLYSYAGSPSQPLSLIFNIASNVVISSSGITGGYRTTAFTVGNFPTGSTVIINNNGYIAGGAGARGLGGNSSRVNGLAGGNGGYGLVKGSSRNYDCTLVNTGTISGGGGGGGGGGSDVRSGGAAYGGYGGEGAGITGYSRTQGEIGQPAPSGTLTIVGGADQIIYGGAGGNGGSNGANGTAGSNAPAGYGRGAGGGLGRPAIVKSGIEIAVSGNIDGGIG